MLSFQISCKNTCSWTQTPRRAAGSSHKTEMSSFHISKQNMCVVEPEHLEGHRYFTFNRNVVISNFQKHVCSWTRTPRRAAGGSPKTAMLSFQISSKNMCSWTQTPWRAAESSPKTSMVYFQISCKNTCVVEPEHLEGQQKIHLKPQCRLFISAKVCVLLCSLSRNPGRAAESSHKKVVSTLNLAIKAGVLNPKPMKGWRKSPKTAMSSFHICKKANSKRAAESSHKTKVSDPDRKGFTEFYQIQFFGLLEQRWKNSKEQAKWCTFRMMKKYSSSKVNIFGNSWKKEKKLLSSTKFQDRFLVKFGLKR